MKHVARRSRLLASLAAPGPLSLAPMLALLLAAPPVFARQDEAGVGGSLLRRARLQVRVESPTRARVSAALELVGGGPVELLLTWFSGQELESSRAEIDGRAFAPLLAGDGVEGASVRRVRVPGGVDGPRSLYLEYTVTVSGERAYRFPLPVPEAPADPAGHSVTVDVELPPGMHYTGDGFPGFDSVSARGESELLRARAVGVPAFVHVVFAEDPGGWPVPLRLQAGAVALTLLPLLGFALYMRRRRTS